MKHKPIPQVPSWDGLEIALQNEARQAARTFASQINRAAQNAYLLDSHRSVMYGARWFVMSWEHASWESQ